MKSTNHRRLAFHKGGVWKNESLSESFGSHWANKVKIKLDNESVFDLACMSSCCWGLPQPKYEPFITHNRGTYIHLVFFLNESLFLPDCIIYKIIYIYIYIIFFKCIMLFIWCFYMNCTEITLFKFLVYLGFFILRTWFFIKVCLIFFQIWYE